MFELFQMTFWGKNIYTPLLNEKEKQHHKNKIKKNKYIVKWGSNGDKKHTKEMKIADSVYCIISWAVLIMKTPNRKICEYYDNYPAGAWRLCNVA